MGGIDAQRFKRSKAALDNYNRTYTDDGTAKNADYAEAVLHTGDNGSGSTNPDDYDDQGRLRSPALRGLQQALRKG